MDVPGRAPFPAGITMLLGGIAAVPLAFAFPLDYPCGGYSITVGGETTTARFLCTEPLPGVLAALALVVVGSWMWRQQLRATGTRAT